MKLTLTVEFSEQERIKFMDSIAGAGGGQQFVRYCQSMLAAQNMRNPNGSATLTLTGSDVDKWFRYRDEYGSGGFQSRLGRSEQQASLL